jgi:hypothetical protein
MKQKLHFTAFIFFLPIFQKLIIINPLAGIQFDIKFFIVSLLVLSALMVMTVIYFCVVVISWINSGFKLQKLFPCLMSLLAIFCIHYSIKSIVNSKIKKVENIMQNFTKKLHKRNTELI